MLNLIERFNVEIDIISVRGFIDHNLELVLVPPLVGLLFDLQPDLFLRFATLDDVRLFGLVSNIRFFAKFKGMLGMVVLILQVLFGNRDSSKGLK